MTTGDINEFCGFISNASTFYYKYLFNEETFVLNPCAEFSLILPINFIFLFFIILGFYHVVNIFKNIELYDDEAGVGPNCKLRQNYDPFSNFLTFLGILSTLSPYLY